MTRVKRGNTRHARHKKVLKLAKGYRASNSKLFRVANEQLLHSMYYSFAQSMLPPVISVPLRRQQSRLSHR